VRNRSAPSGKLPKRSAFWQAAEEKVAKRRQELKEEQEQLRREAERQLQFEVTRRRNSQHTESRMQAMASRLHAEALLDERLQGLASQLLTELTEKNRDVLWQAFCAELPHAEWGKRCLKEVRVWRCGISRRPKLSLMMPSPVV
jgi:hypothetical protein